MHKSHLYLRGKVGLFQRNLSLQRAWLSIFLLIFLLVQCERFTALRNTNILNSLKFSREPTGQSFNEFDIGYNILHQRSRLAVSETLCVDLEAKR